MELHPDKSKIINLSKGVDFVGFRNFYYYKLLRKRNISKMKRTINLLNGDKIAKEKFSEIFQGWRAYSDWTNNFWLKQKLFRRIKSK